MLLNMIKVKPTLIESFIGLVLFLAIVLFYPQLESYYNDNQSLDDWFTIKQIAFTPTTNVGEYPSFIIDGAAHKDFIVNWKIEIQKLNIDGEFKSFCVSHGHKEYKKDTELSPDINTNTWLIENMPECIPLKNSPGQYRAIIDWNVDRGENYTIKKYERITNLFQIIDPSVVYETMKKQEIKEEANNGQIAQ